MFLESLAIDRFTEVKCLRPGCVTLGGNGPGMCKALLRCSRCFLTCSTGLCTVKMLELGLSQIWRQAKETQLPAQFLMRTDLRRDKDREAKGYTSHCQASMLCAFNFHKLSIREALQGLR